MDNINQFILLFDKTNIAKSDFILSIEIFKSYLFDKDIPILNQMNTRKEFIDTFINLTDKFEDSVIYTSKTKSFLSGNYLKKYEQYYLGDYSELLDQKFVAKYKDTLNSILNYGLKPIETKVFEIIRYFTVLFCKGEFEKKINGVLEIFSRGGNKFFEMNLLSEEIDREWFNGVLKLMIDSFYDYQDQTNLNYIIFFACFLVIAILYYFIIWRIYEEKLNSLLKGSVDLINLIPQEIKNIIIEKLNE